MTFRTAIGWSRDIAILVGCAALMVAAVWLFDLFGDVVFG